VAQQQVEADERTELLAADERAVDVEGAQQLGGVLGVAMVVAILGQASSGSHDAFVGAWTFAAIAAVGAVFSEMKFSVAPENWRHGSPPLDRRTSPCAAQEPRPPARVSEAPAARAPRRTSRLLGRDE
jgi:hypothetical protein